jgi:hypothetical protein
MSLMKGGKDVSDLRGIVPIPRKNSKLFSGKFADILNGKWLFFITVTEEFDDS